MPQATAVNPCSPSPCQASGQNQMNNQINSMMGTSGTFGTNSPSVTQTPEAQPNTLQQFSGQYNLLGQKAIACATAKGDQQIAQAAQNNANSGGGCAGGIFGGIAKGIGAIFSFLSEGGPVGMATGGQVSPEKPNVDPRVAAVEGYLTGALHQRDYGGTPDTLAAAAQQVRDHLARMCSGGPVGMAGGGQLPLASGGDATNPQGNLDPSQLAQQTISQALGINQVAPAAVQQSPQIAKPAAVQTNTSPQTASTAAQQVPDQQAQAPVDPGSASAPQQGNPQTPGCNPNGLQACAPPPQVQYLSKAFEAGNTCSPTGAASGGPIDRSAKSCVPDRGASSCMGRAKGGYMEKFADGGESGGAPLKPGQDFQGDGSVKGPGGPTDDLIPAKLSNGEFVMSSAATQYWGVDKLAKMNDQGKQGFMQRVQQVDSNQMNCMPPGAQAQAPQDLSPSLPINQCVPQAAGGGRISKPNTMKPRGNNSYMGL